MESHSMDCLEKKTILLVEDEAITAIVTARTLNKFGYNVETADTGIKAIEIVSSNKDIDLILMDIDLGQGIDGTEAAEIILKTHEIPVVFLSSHTEPEIVEKTEKITSYGYVVKNSVTTVLEVSIKMAFRLFEANKKLGNELAERRLAEEEIRSVQLQYQTLVENINDVIFSLDKNGNFIYVSPINKEITGYNREELTGMPFTKFIYPEDLPKVTGQFKQNLKGIKSPIEFRIIVKDGSIRWIRTSGSAVLKNGKPAGITGLMQDITVRKHMEDMLHENEQRFNLLFNKAPLAYQSLDIDGNFIEVNQQWLDTLGYRREEVIGKWFGSFLSPDYQDAFRKRFPVFKANGKIHSEFQMVHKNGTVLFIAFEGKIAYNPDGEFRQTHCILQDITERRQADEKIRETQFLLQSSIESPKDMIILSINKKYQYLYFNTVHKNVMEKSYGKTPEIGLNILDCTTNENDRIKSKINYDRALAGESHTTVEEYGELKRQYYETRYNPIINDKNEIIGATAFSSNITQRKLDEERIKNLLEEKEIILREVNHRIKNNMNTIFGLLMLQADTMEDSACIAALEDAGRRVQGMMVLYDKLYRSSDFQKISVLKYLPSLVDEIAAGFPNSSSIKIEEKIDDFVLDAKRMQTIGIIINELITNIMKYAFTGRQNGLITVEAHLADNRVSIIIQDNGNTMPESVDFENSTGFGLQLVWMLNRELNGNIRIERANGTKIILEFNL